MYYRPHYSGLTIYTERLARALAIRGHEVTVLTSRFDPNLPAEEIQDGVRIIRPWVMLRASKGVIMPSMPIWAWKLIRQADVINAHVPQPDAAVFMSISKLLNKPSILTYHCDLQLPEGFVHTLANQGSHFANWISANLADVIVTNTMDYAQNSQFLSRYLEKVHAIPPPIELADIDPTHLSAFRAKYNLQPDDKVIGMASRLATEKGVEYLVKALPGVIEKYPNLRVLFAGQYRDVLGEETYSQKLAPLIGALGDHWTFLGILSAEEFSAFFQITEVTVLPSINSTESFGMVQIESMTCGTPVISTDLPGVRQPILMTGMGRSIPPRNSAELTKAIIDILDHPNGYRGDQQAVKKQFSPDAIAEQYEIIFNQLVDH